MYRFGLKPAFRVLWLPSYGFLGFLVGVEALVLFVSDPPQDPDSGMWESA